MWGLALGIGIGVQRVGAEYIIEIPKAGDPLK